VAPRRVLTKCRGGLCAVSEQRALTEDIRSRHDEIARFAELAFGYAAFGLAAPSSVRMRPTNSAAVMTCAVENARMVRVAR
jgi:hypothetical protein